MKLMLTLNNGSLIDLKDRVIDTLVSTRREGMLNFIAYLVETDFFIAPASTKFHGSEEGGLLYHSWHVYQLLLAKNEMFKTNIPKESLIIAGLLHDVCKIGCYHIDTDPPTDAQINYLTKLAGREVYAIKQGPLTKAYASDLIQWYVNKKEGDKPEYKQTYVYKDELPLGHGEKSVIMLTSYILITNAEACAIRWHMLAFDAGIHFNYPSGYAYKSAMESHALVTLLATADIEASNILEGNFENQI